MGVARPTIRCLWDEMESGISPGSAVSAEIRNSAASRRLPHPSIRLDAVEHPVMDDARSYYNDELTKHLDAGGSIPKKRSFSLGPTKSGQSWGMIWYKCRSDDAGSWRGLVCLVSDVFWLGWLGPRRDDYDSFNQRRHSDQHTRHFEPTSDDIDRLALEDAWEAEREAEQGTARWIVNAVLDAWERGEAASSTHPDTEDVAVHATAESDGGGIVDLELKVSVPTFGELQPFYDLCSTAVPGIEQDDWQPTFDGLEFTLYALVEASYLDRLVALRSERGVGALVSDPALAADPTDDLSHVVTTADFGRGYTDGALIRSVCGRRFVPAADPTSRDVCEKCAAIVQALDMAQGESS